MALQHRHRNQPPLSLGDSTVLKGMREVLVRHAGRLCKEMNRPLPSSRRQVFQRPPSP